MEIDIIRLLLNHKVQEIRKELEKKVTKFKKQYDSMERKRIRLKKKIHDKELELLLVHFKKICKLSKRIINSMSKSYDSDIKHRVKYKI